MLCFGVAARTTKWMLANYPSSTATATPIVQDDISQQLGLTQPARFIHGFRRDNIAIEVVEVAPSQRAALACELFGDEERRPGIVYVPTRKQADALAAKLAGY